MIGEMDENGDTEKLNSQPLLSSSSQEQTFSQHQFQPPINTENEEENTEITSEQYQQQQFYKAKPLHKCKTAPAIDRSAVFRELQAQFKTQAQAQAQNSSQNPLQEEDDEEEEEIGSSGMLMVRQAGILLVIYLVMGVLVYGLNKEQFLKGVETHPVVDALYFCIVTMCTIGYGDITPLTPFTKIFACIFVLVGFGFIDTLLSGVVNYILDVQEQTILSDILHHKANHQVAVSSSNQNHEHNQNHKHKDKHNHRLLHFLTLRLVDVEKGRMRIRLKVGLALSVLVVCMGIGTLFLYIVEEMSLVDSVYLSALSVTTVGYGDRAFNTLTGRLFASVWLLVSTLAVARAFLYLVEARIHKRQRTIAKWVLERDITPSDLFAADINNNDHLNKSEYVLFKLKEMGKIGQQEILQICNQFEKLDSNYMGRITPPDLFRNRPSSMKAENLASSACK